MDLILCHQTVDFDAIGAAVGLTRLQPGAKIVLTGGAHPTVKDFLALYRDEFALIELRSVNPAQIRSLTIVDTQQRARLGKAREWLDLPQINKIMVYDHHLNANLDIPVTETQIEAVGATTTLIVEQLQQLNISLTSFESTVMALGIHVDTGSLTFEQTTARDALALAWLIHQKANIKIIAQYVEPSLSKYLQELLTEALANLQTIPFQGYTLAWVLLQTEDFVPGLSSLAERLIDLTESDVLLVAHQYGCGEQNNEPECRLTIIGRSRIDSVNLALLFTPLGGGGHSQAASVIIRGGDTQTQIDNLITQIQALIPQSLTARDIMSSPVRTIRPETTIELAQRILFRYGHSGLSVVDENDQLVGIISRRDLDLALHHGFSHAPVKGYMTRNPRVINPDTSLPEIEFLMVTYDIGRLPVVSDDKLIGIVTRTDILRQIHQDRTESSPNQKQVPLISCLLPSFPYRLHPPIWDLLHQTAHIAQQHGWHIYLVGGAVRDLLLAENEQYQLLQDIDLVVDGFHQTADVGAGVLLASELQKVYPNARLSVHGEFQTAALLWHKDPELNNLWVDIATARTEFYPYPAANPEVEASSIRQDLYRRDFTINALAVRLSNPRAGELLDFFGGVLDLRSRQIRVLHANSFIEDPTRIYRAVRFAVKLNFEIESQTVEYIKYAIASGIYDRLKSEKTLAPALTTRLRAELQYILEATYWQRALQLLADLEALKCIHADLVLTEELWQQILDINDWLKYLKLENNLSDWLMRLEVLIASLNPEERVKVALNLQLPKDSLQRLQQLEVLDLEITKNFSNCQTPSEFVNLFRPYPSSLLILYAVKIPLAVDRLSFWAYLQQYLTNWSKVKPFLNGDDLKGLGYKPGPQYRQILDDLLEATLDGKIGDRNQGEDYLKQYYPPSQPNEVD